MRTIMFVVGVLLAAPSVALQLTRGDAVRSILSAASGAFVALTPLAVVADRGKDLYESDRSILSGGGEINTNVALPEYDSEGRMIDAKGYEEETTMRVLQQGKASVQVLKTWTQSADGTLADPVTGSTASSLTMNAKPSPLSSITDAGKPETISLVSAFGLEPELKRADMVAAAVRKLDGVTYYDYDLALPALDCVPELATACLPSKVVLISCGVRSGALHVLRIDATPDQWRRGGRSIKALRSTFAIDGDASASPMPEG